jgi:hypothetical protein
MIVDKKSVNEVISSLKNGKAADSAGISGEHLKYGGETLLSALTDLINSIFETCTLPELFKLDLVSPVFIAHRWLVILEISQADSFPLSIL